MMCICDGGMISRGILKKSSSNDCDIKKNIKDVYCKQDEYTYFTMVSEDSKKLRVELDLSHYWMSSVICSVGAEPFV